MELLLFCSFVPVFWECCFARCLIFFAVVLFICGFWSDFKVVSLCSFMLLSWDLVMYCEEPMVLVVLV